MNEEQFKRISPFTKEETEEIIRFCEELRKETDELIVPFLEKKGLNGAISILGITGEILKRSLNDYIKKLKPKSANSTIKKLNTLVLALNEIIDDIGSIGFGKNLF